MTTQVKTFLQFHETELDFIFRNDEWWVAIKPICEALKLDYTRQFKNLKADPDLSDLATELTIVAADNKMRKMICLPEYVIYWWLATIRSDSADLRAYRMECAKILHQHFKGSLGDRDKERKKILLEQIKADEEVEKLALELRETSQFKAFKEAKDKRKSLSKQADQLDEYLIQGDLFS